ncbi:helix-turn-helix domain-containing protein [Fusibacillus kribbianus]|uniref:Helix-turn-helix transcriptional regulator n=1 Tax=Fusibacillus kribbianus TaxID=3044208 RepID=A0AAP4F0J0_9FIRM|nr:helix-turn-helix transcriptional regulator [Ruminococcus sp. YH-rum2234]MDI9243400.1 helix-turn-helix transcriptional regulator [Ruminococcus sp. YH-rum2234]
MKEIDFMKIGKKLKEIRISRGLTQEYVANMADVNTSHISNIENKRVKISLPTLVHVCNALNTTVNYILADEYDAPASVLEEEILHELHSCSDETKEQILKIVKAL